jgi:amidase
MARSAADAAAILQAIAGADPDDPTTLSAPVPDYLGGLTGGVSDLVIGIDWSFATDGAAPEIFQAIKTALDVLQGLGARIREIAFPDVTPVVTEIMPMLVAEVAAAHADFYPGAAQLYGPRLRAMIDGGLALDNQMVVRAYQARSRFNGRLEAAFRA